MRIFKTLFRPRPPCYWWCSYMKSCPCVVVVATPCPGREKCLNEFYKRMGFKPIEKLPVTR